jgi:hypothetical protein
VGFPPPYILKGFARAFHRRSKVHQLIPITVQSLLDSGGGGDKDIGLTGFDLLNGSDIQVCQFRQLFLCNPLSSPKAANIAAEGFELLINALFHYGTVWRNVSFDSTAQRGVSFSPDELDCGSAFGLTGCLPGLGAGYSVPAMRGRL